LSNCVVRTYARHEAICRSGDPYDGVYALVDGALRLELTAPDHIQVASVKQPVCWFGQVACLRKSTYVVSLTATTPVTLLFLPYRKFDRLIEDASYCKSFALLTLDHFEEATQALVRVLADDVDTRVAGRLALLVEQSGPERPAVLQTTQSELAEMCGLSRPTVHGVLTRLENRGLLKVGYRKITIMDSDALLQRSP
jgi:CRP/FNR family transcriptional regulator, cyclic AMP receptor protein